eukprot:m.292479 g.292479  ORF g.292479 m.292479 type:complete len:1756 (+) comp15841_c0_seq3:166-5433(+)
METSVAYTKVFEIIHSILNEWKKDTVAPRCMTCTSWLRLLAARHYYVMSTAIPAILLLIFCSTAGTFHLWPVITLIILSVLLFITMWVLSREAYFEQQELATCLETIVQRYSSFRDMWVVNPDHYTDIDNLLPLSSCPNIRCIRDGKQVGVPSTLLVEGDVIYLEAGDRCPADATLCSSTTLKEIEDLLRGKVIGNDRDTSRSRPISLHRSISAYARPKSAGQPNSTGQLSTTDRSSPNPTQSTAAGDGTLGSHGSDGSGVSGASGDVKEFRGLSQSFSVSSRPSRLPPMDEERATMVASPDMEMMLKLGDVVPATCVTNAPGGNLKVGVFIVQQSPLPEQLEEVKRLIAQRPPSWLESGLTFIAKHLTRSALVLLVLLSIVGGLFHRFGINVTIWQEEVFLTPSLAVIPLLPVAYPIMWILCCHFGSARLYAMVRGHRSGNGEEGMQDGKADASSLKSDASSDISVDGGWDEDLDEQEHEVFARNEVIWQRFVEIWQGHTSTLVRTTKSFAVFATLSVMAFVDKAGILAHPTQMPSEVLLFDQAQLEKRKQRAQERAVRNSKHSSLSELGIGGRGSKRASKTRSHSHQPVKHSTPVTPREKSKRTRSASSMALSECESVTDASVVQGQGQSLPHSDQLAPSQGTSTQLTESGETIPMADTSTSTATSAATADVKGSQSSQGGGSTVRTLLEAAEAPLSFDQSSSATDGARGKAGSKDKATSKQGLTVVHREAQPISISDALDFGGGGGDGDTETETETASMGTETETESGSDSDVFEEGEVSTQSASQAVACAGPGHVPAMSTMAKGSLESKQSAEKLTQESEQGVTRALEMLKGGSTTSKKSQSPSVDAIDVDVAGDAGSVGTQGLKSNCPSVGDDDEEVQRLSSIRSASGHQLQPQQPVTLDPDLDSEVIVSFNQRVSTLSDARLQCYFNQGEQRELLQETLKPLCSNIIINSHCMAKDHGTDFAAYIAAIDIEYKGQKVNHFQQSTTRNPTCPQICLCRLSRSVGFQADAFSRYRLLHRFVSFDPVGYQRDYLTMSRQESRAKELVNSEHIPIPHLMATLVQDTLTKQKQLMTSGSCPLILRCCDTYWNGKTLQPLTESMKQRVLEFQKQHQNSHSVYAFAYKPASGSTLSYPTFQTTFYKNQAEDTTQGGAANRLLKLAHEQSSVSDRIASMTEEDAKQAAKAAAARLRGISPDQTLGRTAGMPRSHSVAATYGLKGPLPPSPTASPTARNNGAQFGPRRTFSSHLRPIGQVQPVKRLHQGQVFLGAVAAKEFAMQGVHSTITELDEAGVRFVFFSQENESRTNAFGEELKLQTGWNCLISLSDDGYGDVYHVNNAKLPRGVNQIRQHLEEVDNVPLLVRLFSECSPSSCASMIQIMQENDQAVCCFVSSLNPNNYLSSAKSSVAIAIDPLRSFVCQWPAERIPASLSSLSPGTQKPVTLTPLSSEAFAADIHALPCSFRYSQFSDLKFPSLTQTSRRLSFNIAQSFLLFLNLSLALSLYLTLIHILALPPVTYGWQLVWFVVAVIPLLSMSLLFSPSEKGLLRLICSSTTFFGDTRRFCIYFFSRVLTTSMVGVVVFLLALNDVCKTVSDDCHPLLGPAIQTPIDNQTTVRYAWNHLGLYNSKGLVWCQNLAFGFLFLYFLILSMSFLHRTKPLRQYNPFRNRVWLYIGVGLFTLHIVFSVISVHSAAGGHESAKPKFSLQTWLVGCIWIPALAFISELVKRKELKREQNVQDWAKIDYDTRLGMWSPK